MRQTLEKHFLHLVLVEAFFLLEIIDMPEEEIIAGHRVLRIRRLLEQCVLPIITSTIMTPSRSRIIKPLIAARSENPDHVVANNTRAFLTLYLKKGFKQKSERTQVTTCTYNAGTLAYEYAVEDLLMQVRGMRYAVTCLTEMERRHLFHDINDTEKDCFLEYAIAGVSTTLAFLSD
ncbi:hypothetical protein KIN20_037392 [Parelaphostrongylus tenuis]|uniref:Uncharacterized protein n=1 Tax=Parelaphostrongylus tenuis TaxID=148309 RepID=A0AAD5REP6_PARTN|nr:hypothetical protein KIN20_037392 [Parelaphostrongylus tenuis]